MQNELEELIALYREMDEDQKKEFLELARELAEDHPANDSNT